MVVSKIHRSKIHIRMEPVRPPAGSHGTAAPQFADVAREAPANILGGLKMRTSLNRVPHAKQSQPSSPNPSHMRSDHPDCLHYQRPRKKGGKINRWSRKHVMNDEVPYIMGAFSDSSPFFSQHVSLPFFLFC